LTCTRTQWSFITANKRALNAIEDKLRERVEARLLRSSLQYMDHVAARSRRWRNKLASC
jgi:hypothetical protein